jgi:hypothetical protein
MEMQGACLQPETGSWENGPIDEDQTFSNTGTTCTHSG